MPWQELSKKPRTISKKLKRKPTGRRSKRRKREEQKQAKRNQSILMTAFTTILTRYLKNSQEEIETSQLGRKSMESITTLKPRNQSHRDPLQAKSFQRNLTASKSTITSITMLKRMMRRQTMMRLSRRPKMKKFNN